MRTIRQMALAACAALLGSAAAHADLRVVQKTSIQNPQLTAMIQSMSPAQRAQMAQAGGLFSGKPVILVISTRGNEARVDYGGQATIFNAATRKVITLNRSAHTYSVSAYGGDSGPTVQATVRATGQSQVIQGHRTRRYVVALTSPQLEGGRLTADVWSAPDLPALPSALFTTGPAASLRGLFSSIKGLPLKINALVTGTSLGTTAVQSVATSVSQGTLSSALFQVPRGYRRVVASGTPTGLP